MPTLKCGEISLVPAKTAPNVPRSPVGQMTPTDALREIESLAASYACAEQHIGPAHSNLWDLPIYERLQQLADEIQRQVPELTFPEIFEHFQEAIFKANARPDDVPQ